MGVGTYLTNMNAEVTAGRATKTTLADGSFRFTFVLNNIVPRLTRESLDALPQGTMVVNPNAPPFYPATSGSTEYKINQKMYEATVTITWKGFSTAGKDVKLATFIAN